MSYYSHSTFVGMSAAAPPDPLAGMPSSGWGAGRTVAVQPATTVSSITMHGDLPPTGGWRLKSAAVQAAHRCVICPCPGHSDFYRLDQMGDVQDGYPNYFCDSGVRISPADAIGYAANRARDAARAQHADGLARAVACERKGEVVVSAQSCMRCKTILPTYISNGHIVISNPNLTEHNIQCEGIIKREEAKKEVAENMRLAAVEKDKQEAEKREIYVAQAAKKIQEEKAAAERLAAERELAELFAPQPISPASAPTSVYRAQDWMTKAQFRAMRQRAGFPLNADQHVCHIIAESNGGADHIDNYYVAAGSLNQSLGNRNDAYLAEAAGLEQTSKAVAVSRTTGYTGPGAEELIAMAKAMRTGANTQSRNAPVALPTPTVETVDPAITFSKFMGKVSSIMMGPCPHFARGERGCMIGLLPVERQRAYAERWGETRLEEVPKSLIKEMRAEVEQRLCPSQSVKDALESQRRAAAEQYESTTFTREERILRGTW